MHPLSFYPREEHLGKLWWQVGGGGGGKEEGVWKLQSKEQSKEHTKF